VSERGVVSPHHCVFVRALITNIRKHTESTCDVQTSLED
jgi:hypothetical protein